MDVFAHTLWAAAGARAANRRRHVVSVGWAAFWGVAPDLFAFTIPTAALAIQLLTGQLHAWPGSPEGAAPGSFPLLDLSNVLYSISHSAVVFAVVFVGVWLRSGRPRWELLGWLLHIAIDIPTHTAEFFPTPVFWPISHAYFSGISWATPWFMYANYGALLAVYLGLLIRDRRRR